MDAAFDALGQYDWRVGTIYANPAHLIDAPRASQSTPYYVLPIALRTTQQVYYSAPTFSWKMNQLYPSKIPVLSGYGLATGQAPTSGIYTGIPSGCGPNGMQGGNPYS